MKHRMSYGVITPALVVTLLVSLMSPVVHAPLASKRLQALMIAGRVQAQGSGEDALFLPLLEVPPRPPAFEIISPGDGWTVGGMTVFAVQPAHPAPVSSVAFRAGTTPLGTDADPAGGYRVFLDAGVFPPGPLALTATASGPGGETSRTIIVNVAPNPPASATVGGQGGVLASEIGSIITIPPGALPDGTTVTVQERSQEEVTADHGIDWETLGVTFLGAQNVQASAAFGKPLGVASAGFGARVQPGQTVVNYRILPDADGDGADELIVVNTAGVAPNGDVLSDPVPQAQLDAPAASSGASQSQAGAISGPPGTLIELPVQGFNPLSAFGNLAIFESLVDGTIVELPGTIDRTSGGAFGSGYDQLFLVVIPFLPAGPAMLTLRNESTGSTIGPIAITVEAPVPISRSPHEIIDEFYAGTLAFLEALQEGADEEPPPLNRMIAQMTELQDLYQQLAADPSPEVQQHLAETATMIENSGLLTELSLAQGSARSSYSDERCVTKEQLRLGKALWTMSKHVAILVCAISFGPAAPISAAICALAFDSAYDLIEIFYIDRLKVCEEPPPEPDPQPAPDPPLPQPLACLPAQSGPSSTTALSTRSSGALAMSPAQAVPPPIVTGMGSVALPPGGSGCGNASGPDDGSLSAARAGSHSLGSFTSAGRFIVKVYSNGLPLIFSGATDAGGYFFMPLIPAAEPFVAVATDTRTGATRTVEGTGPATGEFTTMSFNFFSEEGAVETVYWDGGGDGASWHDAFNWNPNTIPGATQRVIIDAPGVITVTHSQGEEAILSLHSEENIVLSGGVLTIVQASAISNTMALGGLYGGTLAGSDELVVSGRVTWANATLRGGGRLVAKGGMVINGGGTLTGGYTLVNGGHATWNGVPLHASGGATFDNLPGASFEMPNDGTFAISTGGATFHNAGLVTKTGGNGISYLAPTFNNSGTVSAQVGTLLLGAGGSSGVFAQGAGTIGFSAGTHILSNTSIVDGANIRVTNSAILEVNGSYNANRTTVSNATLTLNQDASMLTFEMGAGFLTGPGTLTISGLLTWNGGTLRGPGTTIAEGGIAINGGSLGQGYTLVNAGHATWNGFPLHASGGAALNNLPGAIFEAQQDGSFAVGTGGATFNNAGAFIKSGGSSSNIIGPMFNNSGSVAVQSGAVHFAGGYSQTASGVLNVRVGGLTPVSGFDQFSVTGQAALNGTLHVTLAGGFTPAPGDSFKIMTYGARTGEFATVNGNGRDYRLSYSTTDVTLVAE